MKEAKHKKIKEKEKEEENLEIEEITLSDLHSPKIILKDPTEYDYVRKSYFLCCSKKKKPLTAKQRTRGYKLLAYEKPHKTKGKPNYVLTSTYLFLRHYDRGGEGKTHPAYRKGTGITPAEAVRVVEEDKK